MSLSLIVMIITIVIFTLAIISFIRTPYSGVATVRETTFENYPDVYVVSVDYDREDMIRVFGKYIDGWYCYEHFDSLPKVGDKVELGERPIENAHMMFSRTIALIKFKEPATVKRVIDESFMEKKVIEGWFKDEEIEVKQERYRVFFDIPDSTELVDLRKEAETTNEMNQ